MRTLILLMAVACLAACERPSTSAEETTTTELPVAGTEAGGSSAQAAAGNPLRNAYFGDTHIHTILSFDAYLFGTRRTPDDAYEFAKGAAIEHASGFSMQMKKPLDFLAVSDHAFYLGMMRALGDPDGPLAQHRLSGAIQGATSAEGSLVAFGAVLGHLRDLKPGAEDDLDNRDVARSAWDEIIAAAERHNDPGRFTTFVGYEYTSSGPAMENLHRNVIFRGSAVPAQPFARLDSLDPEDLWDWMDANRARGMESIAIPHNSNGSNGWMFSSTRYDSDEPLDAAYAEQRMRNEPLVENSQVKGTSDTHPLLSPNDEWADFEIYPVRVASNLPSQPSGSYTREALINGLVFQEQQGFNPFKFGVIAASDTHNAAGSFEEDNYWSKTGLTDIEPHLRGSVPLPDSPPDDPQYSQAASQYFGASGLAGVWAESNTRDAIFDAFRRKETWSTSGTHIKVRFFGGEKLSADMLASDDVIAQAYANGVPMGGDLTRSEQAPAFYVWAAKDPDYNNLQRLQMVKGWVEDGQPREAVIDIACADGLAVDPATNRCPDNGARVDLSDCSVTPGKGAAELSVIWRDPEFDPEQHAVYYVRVLENPSCRWSTYDAIRTGVAPRPDMHATIQERAWSSPIWYTP